MIEFLRFLWDELTKPVHRCRFCGQRITIGLRANWTKGPMCVTCEFALVHLIRTVNEDGKGQCVVCEGLFPERTLSYRSGEARCVTHEEAA